MIESSFSVSQFEFFLAVLLRIAGAISVAPVFGHRMVNARLRVLLAACMTLLVVTTIEYTPLEYTGVYGFTAILLKELVTGLGIGLMATVCMAIISMAGQFIDREIGLSMSASFDQINGGQSTITANLYSYLILIIMLVSGLHFYVISAVVDSFAVIPLGGALYQGDALYALVLTILRDYFIIALRICMPVFVAATILNIILGIMAKASPQLSMFSIGLQLKVLLGLLVIFLTIGYLPSITNYLYDYIQDYVTEFIKLLY